MAAGTVRFELSPGLAHPALAFLADHRVRGRALLPASAMLEAAVAAGGVLDPADPAVLSAPHPPSPRFALAGVSFTAAVVLGSAGSVAVLNLDPESGSLALMTGQGGRAAFTVRLAIVSAATGGGAAAGPLHAHAHTHPLVRRRPVRAQPSLVASIAPPQPAALAAGGWSSHPAALDAAFHAGAVGMDAAPSSAPRVPTSLSAYAAPDHHLLSAVVPASGGVNGELHASVAAFPSGNGTPTSTHALVSRGCSARAAGLVTTPLGVVDPVAADPAVAAPPPPPRSNVEWDVEWRVVEPVVSGVVGPSRTLPSGPTTAAAAVLAAAQAAAGRPFTLRTAGTGPAAQAAAALLRVAAAEEGRADWDVAHNDPLGDGGRSAQAGTRTAAGAAAWAQLTPARRTRARPRPSLRPAAYAIIGGMGALGSLAATSLAETGAGVVLLGRTGAVRAGALLAALSTTRAATAVACDTGVRSDVRGVVMHSPLTGLLLAGGVLADAALGRTKPAALRAAAAPKAAAAAAWSAATAATPLSSLLAFSSTAAVLGPPGQAAYAAANGALQGWADAGAAAGRPFSAVQWGAWAGGMAAADARTLARLERAGMGVLAVTTGLKALGALMRGLETGATAGGAPLVAAFAWGRLLEKQGADEPPPPLFAAIAPPPGETAAAASTFTTVSGTIQDMDEATALSLVLDAVTAAVGASISPDASLMADTGLDSLGAVELRAGLGTAAGVDLPATFVFDHPSPRAMAGGLVEAVRKKRGKERGAVVVGKPPAAPPLSPRPTPSIQPAPSVPPIIEVASTCARLPGDTACAWAAATAPNAVAVVPLDRWDADATFDPAVGSGGHASPGTRTPAYTRFGAWLGGGGSASGPFAVDGVALGLSPADALVTDPQARLFLEVGAAALVGGPIAPHRPTTAVFVGAMYHEYLDLLMQSNGGNNGSAANVPPQAITGAGPSFLVGRAAFTLGLGGPAAATDTACSSSLVATHFGASALRAREASAALVGGVNLMLRPETTAAVCALGALSPVGRCRALDADADGYGRGEGVAALLLRLVEAGSSPAVILLATSVNHGGRTAGLTAPSGPAQAALVRGALERVEHPAGGPLRLGALTLHGTGTPLGDPIEVGALGSALPDSSPIQLVAPKASLGHTEGTAGVAGLLVALAAHAHHSAPSFPHLSFLNRHVSSALDGWARGARAGIARGSASSVPLPASSMVGTSAFGMSGVNAAALVGGGGRRGPAPAGLGPAAAWVRGRAAPFPLARAALTLAGVGGEGTRLLFGSPALCPRLAAWKKGGGGEPAPVLLELAASAVGCAVLLEGGGALALTAVALASSTPLTWPAGVAVDCVSGGVVVGEGALAAVAVWVDVSAGGAPALAGRPHPLARPLVARPPPVAALAPAAADADAFVIHPAHFAAGLALGGAGRRLAAAAGVGLPASSMPRPAPAWATGRVALLPHAGPPAGSALGLAWQGARQPAPALGMPLAYLIAALVDVPAVRARPARRRPNHLDASGAVAAVARLVSGAAPPTTLALRHVGGGGLGGLARGSQGQAAAAIAGAAAGGALANLPYEAPALTAAHSSTDTWAAGTSPSLWFEAAGGDSDSASYAGGVGLTSRLTYGGGAGLTSTPRPPTSGTSLVSGGLGGLGLLAADWVARSGPPASRIILLGRSGRGDARSSAALSAWPGGGLVVARSADVGSAADTAGVAAGVRASPSPSRPRTFLHAAGVQKGATLTEHAPSITRAVVGPKLVAWSALGGALGGPAAPLTSAVGFGSVSALAGYAGHAAYAAANAALDAAVEGVAASGLPSISIQWGAWAAVGMAAAKVGSNPQPGVLHPAAGVSLLEAALGGVAAGTAGGVMGGAPQAYWTGLARAAVEAGGGVPSLLVEVVEEEVGFAASTSTSRPPPPSPPPPPASPLTLATTTAAISAAVSALTGSTPDPSLPLASQGLDSLAALDLRARLRAELGIDLPGVVGGGATVASLATAAAAAAAAAAPPSGLAAVAAPSSSQPALPSPWSSWIAPAPSTVRLRLFCLPYAGGVSESVFGRWGQLLPPCVQVCPVELPGRGRRRGEAPAEDAAALAADLLRGLPIGSRGDGTPYALFGACLGGIVAYELAAAAVAAGEPPPLVLGVAAVSPPDLYAEAVAKLYVTPPAAGGDDGRGGGGDGPASTIASATAKLRSWQSLPREVVMSVFQKGNFAGVADMAANPRLFDRVAPIGVADILMAVSYLAPPPTRPRLGGPAMHAVLAFEGGRDATIAPGAVAQWARFVDSSTSTPFTLHPIPEGDHYFVAARHREVVGVLGAALLDAIESRLPGGLLGEGHSWVEGA